jgi:hypothetical protein
LGSFKIIVFFDGMGYFPDAFEPVWKLDIVAGAEGYGLAGIGIVADGDPALKDEAFFCLGVLPFKFAGTAGPNGPSSAGLVFLFRGFSDNDIVYCRHRYSFLIDVDFEKKIRSLYRGHGDFARHFSRKILFKNAFWKLSDAVV